MSCQTTPYGSKRFIFSKSELQIINGADIEFAVPLSKFFELVGDYIGLDISIKKNTAEYLLPIDSLLINDKLRNIWVFPTYEKTEYELLGSLEWAFLEDSPSDVRWYPVSKILALSGTTDVNYNDVSKLLKPIMLRNLTDYDVKVKIIISA